MASKILRGRFAGGVSPLLAAYSSSLSTDKEMFYEDVWGSQAHVMMLAKQGIISIDDAGRILRALDEVKEAYSAGKFTLDEGLEDVHMNVENHVIKKCGMEYGGRMHTARSRNEQVLTDVKLHLRAELLDLLDHLLDLDYALLDLSGKHVSTVMPGFTHTQHAQPISFGFWASSYASMLLRDYERVLCAYSRVNVCPLGAGALSGTSFPIDRQYTSRLLGFEGVHVHALDAVSSRDHILETLSALSILMCDLSKLAEELVLWSSFEFGFIEFSDEYATGSSIMPQKKNPDMAELARGKTGRVYGALIQALTLMKGLPSGYNRDMQEDREMLWNALDVVDSTLQVLEGGLNGLNVKTEVLEESVYCDYSTATELANYLVREKGMAFRAAYEATGKMVKELSAQKKDFRSVETVRQMLSASGIEESVLKLNSILDPKEVMARNRSLGGTAPTEVKKMLITLREEAALKRKEVKKRKDKIEKAKKYTEKVMKVYL